MPATRKARLNGFEIGLLFVDETEQRPLINCLQNLGADVRLIDANTILSNDDAQLCVLVNLDAANAEQLTQEFINRQQPGIDYRLFGLSRTGYTFAATGESLTPIRKPVMVSSLLSALANQRSVDLPVVANKRRDSDRKRSRASDASHFDNQTILIVDDNNINQDVVMHLLSGFDLNLLFAEDGKAALDILQARYEKNEDVDIILMDCNMPVMDGFTCTQAVRNGKGGLKSMGVPIIAMTANAMKGERDKCIEAGMDDYITKPVESDILIDKLSLWLNRDSAKAPVPKTPEVEEGTSESVIWDKSDALQRLAGNEALLKRIVKMVLESLDDRLADIANAIDNEDAEALRQHSHKLKGSVGEIGAKSLHILLQSLEHPGAEQDNRAVFSQVVKDSEILRQTLTQYIAA